jgi:hypothetical protein
MKHCLKQQQVATNPPSQRMRDVHLLYHTQSVPTIHASSALRGNLPQRNDVSEEALKKHSLSFSPSAAVLGQTGRAWSTSTHVANHRDHHHGRLCGLLL